MILAIVGLISAGVLGMLYQKTKPRIEQMKEYKTLDALKIVIPDAEEIVPVTRVEPVIDPSGKEVDRKEIVEYYIGYRDKEKKEIAGYAFVAAGAGYSSVVETMVGVDAAGNIKKIKILSQKETPGLGALCERSDPFDPEHPAWTTEQFIGKKIDELKVQKDGGAIVSITGATITSRAVTNSIRMKLEEFLKKVIHDSAVTNVQAMNEEGGN